MIVVVVRFETDGDYHVDNEVAGLGSPPDDDYCHSGIFLCADSDEAESVLERVFKGIEAEGFLWRNFVQMFAEAQCALDDPETMKFGWLKLLTGNYDGTLLFIEEVADECGESKKPIFREIDKFQCELNVCPICGHIVEDVESMENFNYCPGCGQRIDWSGYNERLGANGD